MVHARWGLAVVGVLLVAGCASTPPPDAAQDNELGAPIEVEPGTVISSKHGLVRGTVHADTGLVVQGARVQLVGTEFGHDTGADGRFDFPNVTVGEHRLRVEAKGFRAHEATVLVRAGEVTEIHPTLVPADAGGGDYRTHVHDYWAGDSEVVLLDRSYTVDEFRVHSQTSDAYPEANAVSATVLYANTVYSGLRYRIPIDQEPVGTRPLLVYPGANRVEVTLTWNNAPPGVPSYAFAYASADTTDLVFLPRQGPGQPWSIDVLPHQTDNGHQAFSLWEFFIVPVNNAQAAPDYRPALALDAIQVKIVVFKGSAAPPEPAHPEFWVNGSHLVLRDHTDGAYNVNANAWAVQRFGIAPPKIVPPGTKWIEVEVTWDYTDPAPDVVPPTYVLYYNPGNVHYDRFTEDYKLAPTGQTLAPGVLLFNITLEPGENDAFYQTKSMWRWALRNQDNRAGEDGLPEDFYRSRSYLWKVTAIQDPALGVR